MYFTSTAFLNGLNRFMQLVDTTLKSTGQNIWFNYAQYIFLTEIKKEVELKIAFKYILNCNCSLKNMSLAEYLDLIACPTLSQFN